MEAIKNFLKPGSKDDDQTLYDAGTDPNRGKVAGEGSHFNNHSHTDSGVGGVSSPTSTTNPTAGLSDSSAANPTSGPIGSSSANPTAGVTGSSATKTAEPSYTTGTSQVPIGTASTTDERVFPLSNTGTGATANSSSQTGAGLTDRTAAGTVPAAAGTTSLVQQGTAPQSHFSSSNAQTVYSPAQPADDKCMDTLHGGAHETQIARKIDPCYDGISADSGASGLSSTTYQPTPTSTSRSEALTPGTGATIGTALGAATAGATGSSATRTADPVASTSASRSVDPLTANTSSSHNAVAPAAVGAGAGLAGASAASSHHTSGQTSAENYDGRPSASTASTVPTTASSGIAGASAGTVAGVTHPYSEKAVDPRIDSGNHAATSSQYKTLDPAAEQRAAPATQGQGHHYGRDAAIGGAAGAGAGAIAEHEYSKKEAENAVTQQKELEKQQEHAQKEHEKDVKQHNKEIEKEVKQHNKEIEKEHKQHEKEVEKAEKKHEKEVEKENKQHEKAIAKEEKQHEKEAKQHEKKLEKERKQQEKAEKPGLLDRLLHRGDNKEDNHHTAEAAGAGVAAGAGAGALHEHDKHSKLHKDPPPGYAAEPTKGYASQVTGGTGTTALAQGNDNILPAGGVAGEPGATVPGTRYGSGHDERTASGPQAEYIGNDPSQGLRRESIAIADGTVQSTTPYQPPPASGYATHVTGGTGTTQLAEGNRDPVTNPTKANPLHEKDALTGYAAQVTGGTGTTQLAHGTESTIPTTGMVPGRSGSVAGVTTETPYVDGPKAGTGKYADQVTGGTGTTQLAQGQLDEVAQPRGKSIADKVEEALVLK